MLGSFFQAKADLWTGKSINLLKSFLVFHDLKQLEFTSLGIFVKSLSILEFLSEVKKNLEKEIL